MNSKNNTFSSSYDEKALFLSSSVSLSISMSYCLNTKQSVDAKGLRHYPIVLFKRLNSVPRLIRYINGTFSNSNSIQDTNY